MEVYGPSPSPHIEHYILFRYILRYIDTVFLGQQNHDNQINAKFEKKSCSLYMY